MEVEHRSPPQSGRDACQASSMLPLLQAHIRVRRITVRFTEPGVRDLELKLHSLTSLRPFLSSNSTERQQKKVIFDFDFDSDTEHQDSNAPSTLARTTAAEETGYTNEVVREIVGVLDKSGLMGDDTVRAVKARLGGQREGVRGRRLRLIHAGRILRDGVGLVGYLDESDVRRRIQTRQTLQRMTLSDDHKRTKRMSNRGGEYEGDNTSGEDDGDALADQEIEEEEQVEITDMSVRQLIDWLSAQLEHQSNGDQHPGDGEGQVEYTYRKVKGKDREPGWYDDVVHATIRTARTVYLQCSVGEPESRSSSPPPSLTAPTSEHHNFVTSNTASFIDTSTSPPNLDGQEHMDQLEEPHRGFNRLLSAGLTPSEISQMRTTFLRSHPLSTPYDLIRSREHTQHLLELEESWMDNLASTTQLTQFGDSPTMPNSAAYRSVMEGLMVGFFLPPLIPLFWFRDKPHPSSIPTGGGNADESELDDEEQWERETVALTRDSVFGSTMQISILFGLVANLLMGMFRLIW